MKKVWKSALLAVLVVTALGSCGGEEPKAKPEVEEKVRITPEGQARLKAQAIQGHKDVLSLARRIGDEDKALEIEATLLTMENDTYNWDSLWYDDWSSDWEK